MAVKKAWVDMKVCSQYSVYFKQSAMIESLLPIEIHCWMLVVYGNSYIEEDTTVCCWAREYDELGTAHLCDPEQSEWPVTATSEFHMRKLNMVYNNWQSTQRDIAVKLCPSQEHVGNIIDILQD